MSVLIINDNKEDITCRLCGEQCKRIYGRHLKHSHNNISTKEYKKLFPGAPITALSDRKNTSKNSGLHMKTEKYKKIFSKKIMGDKNPMHRSNTTEQFRKEQSPFSKEFYKKRYPNLTEKEIDNKISDFATEATKNRILPSNKEYWINKGYSEKESIKKVSNHQTTFSKEICIEKYGEKEGLKIWKERQNKWINTMDSKSDKEKIEINRKKLFNNSGYSKISNELFDGVFNKLDENLKNKSYYINNNGEYIRYDKNDKKHYKIDFVQSLLKKAIEFNGDFWHCNPSTYNENYYHRIIRKKAIEIWNYDNIKNEFITEKMGYDLLIIWESEYKKNKKLTIQKCIDFLKN